MKRPRGTPFHLPFVAATLRLTAVALAVSLVASQGRAQAPPPAAPNTTQSLPDGFIVTPPRPIVPMPRFQLEHRLPNSESMDGPSAPHAPPTGGCRYEERKLELLV